MKILNLLFILYCIAQTNSAQAAAPFVTSTDGQEITDASTGLIWRRCAEGMTVTTSSCSGVSQLYTHQAALERARTIATQSGLAWRLPNIKELSSIADRNRSGPSIDITAFTGNSGGSFWSATPMLLGSANAWAVNFNVGEIFNDRRIYAYSIYLVRNGK